MPKVVAEKRKRKPVSVTIYGPVLKRARVQADKEGRNLSNFITQSLIQYLDKVSPIKKSTVIKRREKNG